MMPDPKKQRWIYLTPDVNTAIEFVDKTSKQIPYTYFFMESGAGAVANCLACSADSAELTFEEMHTTAISLGMLDLETADAFSFLARIGDTTPFPYASFFACCKAHQFLIGSCIYDAEIHNEKDEKNENRICALLQCVLIGKTENKSEFLKQISDMDIDVVSMASLDAADDYLSAVPWPISFRNTLAHLLPDAPRRELTDLMCEFTHMAEQMIAPERPYHAYMNHILENGNALRKTSGEGFYADIQCISIMPEVSLFCFQLPGGGNIFLLKSADEQVMIDTGYGCYYPDVQEMFSYYGLDITRCTKIIITHGDADHCGASGYFKCPVYMHKETYDIILTNNRAKGSIVEKSVPEQGYTTMINRLSGMHPSMNPQFFPEPQGETVGGFSVLDTMNLVGLSFQILLSCGGHQHGLVYLLCREQGLLFTSDTILNLEYLSEERSTYNQFAVYFLTTVNVNPELVRRERKALLALASAIDQERKEKGMPPLCICCGHGPLSYMDGSTEKARLIPNSKQKQYRHYFR